MKALLIVALFATLVIAPALIATPTADACQPVFWRCPLNGQWYVSCGPSSPPPALMCARDMADIARLP